MRDGTIRGRRPSPQLPGRSGRRRRRRRRRLVDVPARRGSRTGSNGRFAATPFAVAAARRSGERSAFFASRSRATSSRGTSSSGRSKPQTPMISRNVSRPGSIAPRSQRAMTERLRPLRSASCCCVSPARSRASRMRIAPHTSAASISLRDPLRCFDPYLLHYPEWRRAVSSPSPILGRRGSWTDRGPRRRPSRPTRARRRHGGGPGSARGTRGGARRGPRRRGRSAAARRPRLLPRTARLASGTDASSRSSSLRQARDDWLRRLETAHKSESALVAYRVAIDDLLDWCEGECRRTCSTSKRSSTT